MLDLHQVPCQGSAGVSLVLLGHYEIRGACKWDGHLFSAISRNNLESGCSEGAVEPVWIFPFGDFPYLEGSVCTSAAGVAA